MDARPPAPPFTRPPDRHLIHNPNHQPPTTAHVYPSYAPSSQAQPSQQAQQAQQTQQTQQTQQPMHVPFATSTDPYATSRRDPFLPQTSHHVRQRSHGALEGAQAHNERSREWGH